MSKERLCQVVWSEFFRTFVTKLEKLIHNLTRVVKIRALIMIVLNYSSLRT